METRIDGGATQHIIAVEIAVWSDSYEQARIHLQHELDRLKYDSEMEEVPNGT